MFENMKLAQRRILAVALAAMGTLLSLPAASQQTGSFKIGVIDDMSGAVSELGGPGSLLAATMAVEDFGGKVLGRKIEIVSADHQNRPDVATSIAQRWLDKENVEVILSGGASTTSLAIQSMAKTRPTKTVMVGGSYATQISGVNCTPNSMQFNANNYSLATPLTKYLTKVGLNSWYILVVDYSAGHAAQAATTSVVEASGGKVVGAARFPLDATDMSAYILQALSSKPKVLAFAQGGDQGQNIVKAAAQFGLVASGTRIAQLSSFITDVHAVGLKAEQGSYIAESFYWDLNEKTREFSKRFFLRHKKMPTQSHASAYAAIAHYLQAVQAMGTADATKVVSKMKATEVNNAAFQGGRVREDGAYVRPIYIFEIKKPEESKYAWDYYKLVSTIPGDQAFQPMKEQGCPNPTK